jgi:nucleoside-diphosphate-sugar epimerase
MKRVLVTGASGCVGQHAIARLAAREWQVHAVSSRTEQRSPDAVVWHHADLLDPEQLRAVVAAAEATHLLHLAWYVAPGRWAAAPENYHWVRASLELLDAFRAHGGQRMVTAGSCLEYDWSFGYCSEARTPLRPHTTYGVCKHALQQLTSAFAGSHGLTSAWGRIFFLYGPHEHPDRLVASVIRSLLAGEPARCSHGNQVRDYLFVEDVADLFVALLDSQVAGPINVASGEAVRLREIITRIGELLGRPDLIRLGAIPQAPTDTPLVVGDTARLAHELAWRPQFDLDRGLERTIAWWRSRVPVRAAHSS